MIFENINDMTLKSDSPIAKKCIFQSCNNCHSGYWDIDKYEIIGDNPLFKNCSHNDIFIMENDGKLFNENCHSNKLSNIVNYSQLLKKKI